MRLRDLFNTPPAFDAHLSFLACCVGACRETHPYLRRAEPFARRGQSVRCRRTRARAALSLWTLSSYGIFSAARRRSSEATLAYHKRPTNVHVHTSCLLARPTRQLECGLHGIRTVCGSSIGSAGSRNRQRKKLPRLGAPGQYGGWSATRPDTLVADQPHRLSTTALAAATGGLRGTTAPPPAQRAARSLPEARSGTSEGRRAAAAAAASPCGAAWPSSALLSSARRSAHPARPARGTALAACAAVAPAARQPPQHSITRPRRPPTTTSCTACSARTSAAPRATSYSAPRCPRSSGAPQRRPCPATHLGALKTNRVGPPRRAPPAGARHPADTCPGGGNLRPSGSPGRSCSTTTACSGLLSACRAARWAAPRPARARRV